jgi:DeoR family transcriptional regulator of aga operon/DeoR family fructose operon transcriptional repressor
LLCSRNIRVIVLGGKLHSEELIMTGPIAEATLNRFYADMCILGAAGVDPQVGLTELDYEVASLHRSMMERSRQTMVLTDHSKLGFRAPAVVAPVAMIKTLVTDQDTGQEKLDQLRDCRIQVVLASKHTSESEEQLGKQQETRLHM